MKLQEEDQEIHAFFQALKEKDKNVPVPKFPEIKKTKTINWWIPMGIAASLAAGFFFLGEKEPPAPPAQVGEVVIITLEEGPDQEMQFNIEHTNEMDIWESPTASLLTEY